MTDLAKHYDTSYESRMNRLSKRFRQHHVDIQRLWKLCAPLGQGVPQGGGAVFVPPFDEPPSGGTAQTGTPCKNRYCVSRYANDAYQTAGTAPSVAWTVLNRAEGPPDNSGAQVSLPTGLDNSHVMGLENYNFTIPIDAINLSFKLFVRAYKTGTPAFVPLECHLKQNEVIISQREVVSMTVQEDWQEYTIDFRLVGSIGPANVNTAGFGAFLRVLNNFVGAATIRIDSVRIEVCYDLYTLSGTCSENPG